MTTDGSDTLIDLGNNDKILLANIGDLSLLDSSDFIF